MREVVERPGKYWEIMRKMRTNKKMIEIPGYMRDTGKDRLEGNEKKIAGIWVKAYHRKEYKCKTEEGDRWRQAIKRDVKIFERKVEKRPGKEIDVSGKKFG
jgi:hypothetical protein